MNIELFSQRIKSVRKQKGIDQIELAEKIGCSSALLCCLENGKKTPSAKILCSLANELGVTIDYLCGRE